MVPQWGSNLNLVIHNPLYHIFMHVWNNYYYIVRAKVYVGGQWLVFASFFHAQQGDIMIR